VFAFIYEGSPNWQQANAIVTVSVPNHPVIEVKLDASSSNLRMGAIAMI
jgi:tellurite resistance protein TerA